MPTPRFLTTTVICLLLGAACGCWTYPKKYSYEQRSDDSRIEGWSIGLHVTGVRESPMPDSLSNYALFIEGRPTEREASIRLRLDSITLYTASDDTSASVPIWTYRCESCSLGVSFWFEDPEVGTIAPSPKKLLCRGFYSLGCVDRGPTEGRIVDYVLKLHVYGGTWLWD